jgi:hypothetical protein
MKLPAFLLTAALATLIGCARADPPRPTADPAPAEAPAAPGAAVRGPAAPAEDKVLAAGPPPLTQKTVKLYQDMWEWYCDVELTPEQRRQFTQHFVDFWTKADPTVTRRLLAGYGDMEKYWRGILALKGGEQERRRIAGRKQWVDALRKSTDAPGRFLASVYDAAYRPGGTKNPILVPGDPPLTKQTMDQRVLFVEWLLRLSLTEGQRRDYQALFLEEWQRSDRARKESIAKDVASWKDLPTWNNYLRNDLRARNLPYFLPLWRRKGAGADDRWLAALYESAHRVGGPRNPMLVAGEPALTQAVVDGYGDYLEWAIDLSLLGGFSSAQRDVLKDYLIRDWKKMTAGERKEVLDALGRWAEVSRASPARRKELHTAWQAKLVADLRTARTARSVWLLAAHDAARAEFKRQVARLTAAHRRRMMAIDAMPDGTGSFYRYNPATRRYELVLPAP